MKPGRFRELFWTLPSTEGTRSLVTPTSTHLTLVRSPPTRPVSDGEVPTLAEAFRRYAPYVARIASRILGRDNQEVDDLVQDVFAEAATGLAQLRDTSAGSLKGWLATVTVRAATRRLRAQRVRRMLFRESPFKEPLGLSAFASPEQRALAEHVYRLLERLPARQQVAWILRHVEEQSLDEIARNCNCSIATAKRAIAGAEHWIERRIRR
jgi:RNA polymerase sigma-70 factor (ECF subfamily)